MNGWNASSPFRSLQSFFAVSIWAVRKGAPTNLPRAGAFAGLIAGGVSAMAYARPLQDDFAAVYCRLVRRNDCAVHSSRCSIRARLLRW